MRQLVELNKNANKFEELGVEVIAVFREDEKAGEGLKIIKEKTKVPFTLALDKNKEKTAKYSPGRRKFDNYIIDSQGKIRAIIPGSLTKRANSEQLMKVLKEINSDK